MLSTPVVLVPAPGKYYHTFDDMHTAWLNGADFQIWNGRRGAYCSIRDIAELSREASSITITTMDCRLQFNVPMRDVWESVTTKRGY